MYGGKLLMKMPSIYICIYGIPDISGDDTEHLTDSLGFGEEEKKRLRDKKNASSQSESLAAMLALSELTKLACPSAPGRIIRDANGRPFFENGEQQNIDFSLSHSGKIAVAALASGESARVGVDTEPICSHRGYTKIAQRFFSEAEKSRLDKYGQIPETFFRIWTEKEAHAKYTGKGLSAFISENKSVSDGDPLQSPLFFRSYKLIYRTEEYIITVCIPDKYKKEKIKIINKCKDSEIYELQN